MNAIVLAMIVSFTVGLAGEVICSETERTVLAMQLDGCTAVYAYSICGDRL